jgi:hypothetical protein
MLVALTKLACIGRNGIRETIGLTRTGLSCTTRRIPYREEARIGIVLLILATIILISGARDHVDRTCKTPATSDA